MFRLGEVKFVKHLKYYKELTNRRVLCKYDEDYNLQSFLPDFNDERKLDKIFILNVY